MCSNMHTTTDMRHDLILICNDLLRCTSFRRVSKEIHWKEREIYKKIESFCNGMKTKQRKGNLSLYLVIVFFYILKYLFNNNLMLYLMNLIEFKLFTMI